MFEEIQKSFTNYLIIGDLNAKTTFMGCDKTNGNGKILESILLNLEGIILNKNHKPTFHIYNSHGRNDYHSLIDLFYGSIMYSTKTAYKVIDSMFIDSAQAIQYHSAIELKLNLQGNNEKTINTESIPRRLYEKSDWLGFQDDLNEASKRINNINDKNILMNSLNNEITNAINNNIPFSSNKRSSNSPLPTYILKEIACRNKLRRLYVKNRTPENKVNLYSKIEEVKKKITIFNSQKWKKFINKIGPNPLSTKIYWKRINRVRHKKKTTNTPNLFINDTLIDTDEGKANDFGKKLFKTFNDQPEESSNFNATHFVEKFFEKELY